MAIGFKCGVAAIPENATDMVLTGLALGFTPESVQVSVRQPTDGDADIITAYLAGAPTSEGFNVIFSAPVQTEGYVLQWSAVTADGVITVAGDTLSVSYDELCDKVARFLGYNPTSLSEAQTSEIDDYVQTGVRNFYYPPAMDGADANFEWSFMRMAGSVTTADGVGDYLLPDGFGRVAGMVRIAETGKLHMPLAVVSKSDIEAMRRHSQKGTPRAVAFVYVKDTFGRRGQRMQMLLAPVPDAAFTLAFDADADTGRLSSDLRPFPLGGFRFAELLVESCLSAAEQRANDEIGIHTQNFQRQLIAAIAKDRKTGASVYGPMSMPSPCCPPRPEHFPITYKGSTW